MMRHLGRFVTALCFCMFLASTGHGKQLKTVYLKDGSKIECQSFWKKNGKVMVLVNRDVLVDLAQDEVDMKRTRFTAPKRPKVHKTRAVKKEATAPLSQKAPPQATPEGKGAAAGTAAVRQRVMTTAVKPSAGAIAKPPGTATGEAKKTSPAPATGTPATGTPATAAAPAPRPIPKLLVPPPAAQPVKPPAAIGEMFGIGVLLPFLLILVLMIASFWKVFTKAGEAGWQSIIPLYNMFILVKISGKPWWWFLLILIPVVNVIVLILVQIALAERFNRGPLFGLGLAFLGFIFYPLLAFGNATYE